MCTCVIIFVVPCDTIPINSKNCLNSKDQYLHSKLPIERVLISTNQATVIVFRRKLSNKLAVGTFAEQLVGELINFSTQETGKITMNNRMHASGIPVPKARRGRHEGGRAAFVDNSNDDVARIWTVGIVVLSNCSRARKTNDHETFPRGNHRIGIDLEATILSR